MIETLTLFAHGDELDIHLPAAFWLLIVAAAIALILALLPAAKTAGLRNAVRGTVRRMGAWKAALLAIAAVCIVAGVAVAWTASTLDDGEVSSEVEQQRLQVLREPPMPDSP